MLGKAEESIKFVSLLFNHHTQLLILWPLSNIVSTFPENLTTVPFLFSPFFLVLCKWIPEKLGKYCKVVEKEAKCIKITVGKKSSCIKQLFMSHFVRLSHMRQLLFD